uniref:Protein aurora borealis n=1 Tax=Caenorhabditis japonica TaxID=281687 RepID=A0A8R1DZ55_CAEJA
MELNVSSFYDGEELSKHQLDSTALEHDDPAKENEKNEWKFSPIVAEDNRTKTSVFRKKIAEKNLRNPFKSPLKSANLTSDASTSAVNTSPETKLSISADISSFIANNSLNPFDSILLNSLHKSINFSPRVVFSQESSGTQPQKDGEKFQWSVEQLAILKPAHISEDEIAASYRSPIPEVEEKIQEALNEYWTKNVSYIPSPDGPRYVHLPHRDGTVTTIKYGDAVTEGATPSLANLVRKKEAVKAAYATSSPKQRPRSFRNIRQVRNRTQQTELTIPPNVDLDLKKLLGDDFVYQKEDEEEDEEVFDVSVCSNFSTRRRLFSAEDRQKQEEEEQEEEHGNSSMLSMDDPLLNESGQPFNDSLSPVRRSEDVTEECLEEESTSSQSAATRSHVSQIAINVSILNDCMMRSMDEEDVVEEKNDAEEEEEPRGAEEHEPFRDSHFHANEYEILDRSSSSNATPRHEDLDWTPRRIGSASVADSASGTARAIIANQQSDFRRFMFDMSPIHPHSSSQMLRTPIQRCHLQFPPGFQLDDENDDEDEEEDQH